MALAIFTLFKHPLSYVGSNNLTLSGLRSQGELNVEVVDRDDTNKLEQWFAERWDDRFCLDITEQLAEIIDESWAGRSLLAFGQSPEPEDWQQLMSRYMVRRTRSFIKNTYARGMRATATVETA